jgi:hypothetical protein
MSKKTKNVAAEGEPVVPEENGEPKVISQKSVDGLADLWIKMANGEGSGLRFWNAANFGQYKALVAQTANGQYTFADKRGTVACSPVPDREYIPFWQEKKVGLNAYADRMISGEGRTHAAGASREFESEAAKNKAIEKAKAMLARATARTVKTATPA